MSLNSSPVLQLEPRLHRRIWGALLLLAVGAPWLIPDLRMEAAAGFSLINAAAMRATWRFNAIAANRRVLWDAAGGWWLIDAQGRRHAAKLRADSAIYSGYCLLRWNCEGRRMQRLVLRTDCTQADWRRWQARLHWQARAKPPPRMSL